MGVDLRQLRYFVAVAEELHFGKAAERLAISQPPLSTQIARLERQLGFSLFERTNRKVALAPGGAALLEYARKTVAEAERVDELAARIRDGHAGTLRIGFVGSSIFETLPSVLRAFRQSAPDVRLKLHSGHSTQHAQALIEHRLDLALLRPLEHSSELGYVTVREDALMAVIPRESRFGTEGTLSLSDLADEGFILFKPEVAPGLHDCVMRACAASGFQPRREYSITRMQDLVGFVAAGLGVSLVPEAVSNLRLEGVVYRRLSDAAAKAELAIAYPLTTVPDPTSAWVKLAIDVALGTTPARENRTVGGTS